MSTTLLREVLEYLPSSDLQPLDRLLLVVLADFANDKPRTVDGKKIPARISWPSSATLCELLGVTESGLKTSLRRLAAAGLDVRVPLDYDRRGEPIYAVPGTRRQFRLPNLTGDTKEAPETVETPPAHPVDNHAEGVTTATPSTPEGVTTASARGHHSIAKGSPQHHLNHKRTTKEPIPSASVTTGAPRAAVDSEEENTLPTTPQPEARPSRFSEGERAQTLDYLTRIGEEHADALALIARAERDTTTHSLRRLRTAQYRDDLRAAIINARNHDHYRAAQVVGPCEHGDRSGRLPTRDGQSCCPLCRAAGIAPIMKESA